MRNDAKFLRIKDDPVTSTPIAIAPVGSIFIDGTNQQMLEATGDGQTWESYSSTYEFPTDKRFHVTFNGYRDADPWDIDDFFSGVLLADAFSYTIRNQQSAKGTASFSLTTVIDVPANTSVTFRVSGFSTQTYVPNIYAAWSIVATDFTYVPEEES